MSLLTVAHQRGSGEFIRFTESHGGGGDDVSGDGEHGCGHDDGSGAGGSLGLNFNQVMQQGEVTMQGGSLVSGYNRGDPELREIVSALTHVVSSGSGQRSTEWTQQSGFPMMSASSLSRLSAFSSSSPSPSSGASWVGHKRGREEEENSTSHNLMQQQQQSAPRLFRNIGDFMVPSQGDSSSGNRAKLNFPENVRAVPPIQPFQATTRLTVSDSTTSQFRPLSAVAPPFIQQPQIQGSSDLIRDYLQYSQLLQSDFQQQQIQQQQQQQRQQQQQQQPSSLLQQLYYNAQFASLQSPSMLSSSPSFSSSVSPAPFPLFTTSASFPLFSSQQMGYFQPPESRNPAGGVPEFPTSTWSDTSSQPPPSG
ncbi:hypothetical protein JHK82_045253 [Glycine max]|nr:hypothetical protein JHK82_045253 [Glycine max]